MNNIEKDSFLQKSPYVSILLPALFVVAISFVDWPDILLEGTNKILLDREVYTEKFRTRDSVLNYFNYRTTISYFTSEYTWQFLAKSIMDGDIPIHYEDYFQIISTIFLVLSSVILYRRGGWLAILMLANPIIFDLAYSQLRSALAISFLYLVYIFPPKRSWIALAICLFAATIHTTMIIFLAAYLFCMATGSEGRLSRWPIEWRLALVIGAGLAVGIAIGPLRETLLTLVDDRRAEYDDLSSSYLYLSFWVLLLGIFIINFREVFRFAEGRFSIFILSIVFINVFSGGYSIRFLAIAFPFIMSTILACRLSVRSYILTLFAAYVAAQWYYYLYL